MAAKKPKAWMDEREDRFSKAYMAFALGYGTMPDHIVYGLAERNAEELIRRCHNEILSELSFNPKEEKDKKP